MTETHPLAELRSNWGWLLAVGIVMVLCGMVAIAVPLAFSIGIAALLGWLLLIGGVFQVVHTIQTRAAGSFGMRLIGSVLMALAGLLLVTDMLAGVVTLTLLIAFYLLADGLSRVVYAFQVKPAPGWGWLLFGGAVTVLLGILVIAGLPGTATWLIGTLVGVHLLFEGASFVAMAFAIHELPEPAAGGAA